MDAALYLKEWKRMCKTIKDCRSCTLHTDNNDCGTFSQNYPEKAIEIVEQWSKENPVKTILDDFFEKHPKAPKNEVGIPYCCPWSVGYQDGCEINHGRTDCKKCWSRPLEVN